MSSETLALIFDQFDDAGKGVITRDGFMQFLTELGRDDLPAEYAERCFQMLDQRGDGKITRDAFVQVVPQLYEVDFCPSESMVPKRPARAAVAPRISKMSKAGDPADLFKLVRKVGKGTYGVVYEAIDNRTNERVALKVVDCEGNEDGVEEVQREVMFQAHCNSPYITKYHGSYMRGAELWISMEFVGGGSAMEVMRTGVFSEAEACVILRDVVRGLHYLHSEHKMHRDIKAANILLTEAGNVKLADFGVAAQMYMTVAAKNTFAGTPLWMAPEVILQQPQTEAVDIWSLGIAAIELVKGLPPKHNLHPMQVLFSVPDDPPPRLEGDYSDVFKDFVAACLQKDPQTRATASQLLDHPFLQTDDTSALLVPRIKRYLELHGRNTAVAHGTTTDRRASAMVSAVLQSDDFWDFDTATTSRSDAAPPPPVASASSATGAAMASASGEAEAEAEQAAPSAGRRGPPQMEADDDGDDDERERDGDDAAAEEHGGNEEEARDTDVALILARCHLQHLGRLFNENDIDLDAFLMLTEKDLVDLGVKLGSRKKLLKVIPALRVRLGKDSPVADATRGADAVSPPPPQQHQQQPTVSPGRPRPPHVAQWQTEHVASWLVEVGFGAHVETFRSNGIDGVALASLELASLKELGVELVGDRVKLLAAIGRLRPPRRESADSLALSDARSSRRNSDESDESMRSQLSSHSSSRMSLNSESGNTTPVTRRKSLFNLMKRRDSQQSESKRAELQAALVRIQKPASARATAGAAARVEIAAPNICAEDLNDPVYTGWLLKQGGSHKNWKRRWFVLQDFVLYYFPSPKGTKAKGAIVLPSYNMWIATEIKKKFAFKAQHASARTYYFVADTFDEMKKWMTVMQMAGQGFDGSDLKLAPVLGSSASRPENEDDDDDSRDE